MKAPQLWADGRVLNRDRCPPEASQRRVTWTLPVINHVEMIPPQRQFAIITWHIIPDNVWLLHEISFTEFRVWQQTSLWLIFKRSFECVSLQNAVCTASCSKAPNNDKSFSNFWWKWVIYKIVCLQEEQAHQDCQFTVKVWWWVSQQTRRRLHVLLFYVDLTDYFSPSYIPDTKKNKFWLTNLAPEQCGIRTRVYFCNSALSLFWEAPTDYVPRQGAADQ